MEHNLRAFLALFVLCGCAGLIPAGYARTPACVQANFDYRAWKSVALVSSGFAGATAAGGLITRSVTDEPIADIVLAGTSVVFTGLATLGEFLSGEAAEDVNRECTEPTTFTISVPEDGDEAGTR